MGEHLRQLVQASALGFEPDPDVSVSLALEAFSSILCCMMEITKCISDNSMNISSAFCSRWERTLGR